MPMESRIVLVVGLFTSLLAAGRALPGDAGTSVRVGLGTQAQPPTLSSAATNAGGTVITITFDKNMADPAGKQAQFSYRVGSGTAQAFRAASLDGADAKKINLTASGTAIAYGDVVTVSYTAGDVVAADTGVLASFADQAVTNNMPGLGAPAPQPPSASAGVCVKLGDGFEKALLDRVRANWEKLSPTTRSGDAVSMDLYIEGDNNGRIVAQTKVYYYGNVVEFIPNIDGVGGKTEINRGWLNSAKHTISQIMATAKDPEEAVNVGNYVKELNTRLRLVAVPRITLAKAPKQQGNDQTEEYYIVTPITLVPTRVVDGAIDQSSVAKTTPFQRCEKILMDEKTRIDWEKSFLAPAASIKKPKYLVVSVDNGGCLPLVTSAIEGSNIQAADQRALPAYPKWIVEVTPEARRFVQCCMEFWRRVDAAIDPKGTAQQQTPFPCALFKDNCESDP